MMKEIILWGKKFNIEKTQEIELSGIKGIIVEKNNTLIANPEETFKLIKKHKLFYYAV